MKYAHHYSHPKADLWAAGLGPYVYGWVRVLRIVVVEGQALGLVACNRAGMKLFPYMWFERHYQKL
jgi:hypothetical protein